MSIPSWAVRGAKVVCVDAGPGKHQHSDALTLGGVYTIGRVYEVRGQIGVSLIEATSGGLYGAYRIGRFRPLITIEDDLKAHFAHLLDAPVRVSEEA